MKRYLLLLLLFSPVLFAQTEKVLLDNGLYPNALMNQDGEIIVSAIFWDVPYAATAQKIDLRGNTLWSEASTGIFITQPYSPEYAFFDAPIILPSSDGGAFFIYDYAYWVEGTYEPELYKTWPAIQKVNNNGDVLWGRTGIQLSNREINPWGGSTILSANFTPDGDIIVLWSWYIDADPQEFTAYGQKIDPETGELLWGETGRKYFNSSSQKALISKDQIYVFHGDSVLCLDRNGMLKWDLELTKDIGEYIDTNYSVNDSGDVCIVYSLFLFLLEKTKFGLSFLIKKVNIRVKINLCLQEVGFFIIAP